MCVCIVIISVERAPLLCTDTLEFEFKFNPIPFESPKKKERKIDNPGEGEDTTTSHQSMYSMYVGR